MSWNRQIPEDDVLKMENYLGKLLSPVQPRDGFVRDLRQGLGQHDTKVSEPRDVRFNERVFWIGAGFASAVVFITVGIRLIINLVKNSDLRNRKQRRRHSVL